MASRTEGGTGIGRILETRQGVLILLEAWRAAANAGGVSDLCAAHLERAETSFAAGDSELQAGIYDPTNGLTYYANDPEVIFLRAQQHLEDLGRCLGHPIVDEPPPSNGGGSSSSGDEQPSGAPPVSPLPASGSGLRVVAGLGLIGLAVWGLFRMSRR